MKRLATAALALVAFGTVLAEDVPPMILARHPVRVWRNPSHYRVTYADGRTEIWWQSPEGTYQVGGDRYHTSALGFDGPRGERYRKVANGWDCSGRDTRFIRRATEMSYTVGTSRYAITANGCYLMMPGGGFVPRPSPQKTIRMKHSRPSAFKSSSEN